MFPEYQLYVSQHWCAIAHLSKSKLDAEKYDEYMVMNWLGHSEIQTTIAYIRDAEQYMKRAPYDWFQRVLKYYKKTRYNRGKHAEISTQSKNGVLTTFSTRRVNGPAEI